MPNSASIGQPRVALTQYKQSQHSEQEIKVDMELQGAQSYQAQMLQSQVQSNNQTAKVTSYDSVVTQVYKTFLRRRSEDKTVSIRDVLNQEPYSSQISQGILNERELERSV